MKPHSSGTWSDRRDRPAPTERMELPEQMVPTALMVPTVLPVHRGRKDLRDRPE